MRQKTSVWPTIGIAMNVSIANGDVHRAGFPSSRCPHVAVTLRRRFDENTFIAAVAPIQRTELSHG